MSSLFRRLVTVQRSTQPQQTQVEFQIKPRDPSRRWLVFACAFLSLAGVVAWAQEPSKKTEKDPKDGKIYLLKSKDFFKKWTHYSAEEGTKREDMFKLVPLKEADKEELILQCTGKPFGYLRSMEAFDDCEFGLEWKFPKAENGNSGILVFTDGKDGIWPMSIQIQLHSPQAGRVFPMEGAKCATELPGKMLTKPVNKWNRCKITCREGTIEVVMNGQNLGQVRGCMPNKGFIALQSEGHEVHFRNIWKRKLKKTDVKK